MARYWKLSKTNRWIGEGHEVQLDKHENASCQDLLEYGVNHHYTHFL